MRIYLDNCCFNRPFDDQKQLRIELETKAKTIMQHLVKHYGHVETERFISLVIKDPFDYTKWSGDLFGDMTTDELFDEI